MAVESIGTVLQSPEPQLRKTSIGQDDLFKIMLTQLSYQDPMKPLDNKEFIAQLAQFSNLEQNQEINEKITALLTLQAANQSIGLIGKTVEVQTQTGNGVGNITAITFNRGEPQMTIRTTDGAFLNNVSLSQIYIVR